MHINFFILICSFFIFTYCVIKKKQDNPNSIVKDIPMDKYKVEQLILYNRLQGVLQEIDTVELKENDISERLLLFSVYQDDKGTNKLVYSFFPDIHGNWNLKALGSLDSVKQIQNTLQITPIVTKGHYQIEYFKSKKRSMNLTNIYCHKLSSIYFERAINYLIANVPPQSESASFNLYDDSFYPDLFAVFANLKSQMDQRLENNTSKSIPNEKTIYKLQYVIEEKSEFDFKEKLTEISRELTIYLKPTNYTFEQAKTLKYGFIAGLSIDKRLIIERHFKRVGNSSSYAKILLHFDKEN